MAKANLALSRSSSHRPPSMIDGGGPTKPIVLLFGLGGARELRAWARAGQRARWCRRRGALSTVG
jgi:hypothetical protein